LLDNAELVGMMWLYGNATGWVKLQVDDVDEERARRILDQAVLESTDHSQWRCTSCGSHVPGNFQMCWSCGKPKGDSPALSPEEEKADDECWDEDEPGEGDSSSGDGEPSAGNNEPPAGDAVVRRAFYAAILGMFACPPMLHIYSLCLLFRVSIREMPLSPKYSRLFRIAMALDFVVCVIVLLFWRICLR
jgi:hypothetical protein